MKFSFRPFFFFALWVIAASQAMAVEHIVRMVNYSFSPANLTINVNDSVVWVNEDFEYHNTVSGTCSSPDGAGWNSDVQGYPGFMFQGDRFTNTFTTTVDYDYVCVPHCPPPESMRGHIEVVSPPSVTITNPINGQIFFAPADITIEAIASDLDDGIAQVEFFANGTSIRVATIAPYNATAAALGPGIHTLTAVATDNSGTTATNSVTVTVTGQSPTITTPPQSQTVSSGGTVFFSVSATGSSPLNYQWFFNQTPIAGAINPTLTLTNVSTSDSGDYMVLVNNSFGAASNSATLTVTNLGGPPSITAQPQSQTVDAGTNVVFVVNAIGSSPLDFQWFFNQTPIAGATNSLLLLTNVSAADAGDYLVVISNPFGSVASSTAVLTVIVPPVCDFTLSASNTSFTAAGGTGSVDVATSTNCDWTVVNNNSWISISSGNSGVGSATVTFNVGTNAALTPRAGDLLIAGNVFTVTQDAAIFAAKGDFNKDGYTDFLWQHKDGLVALWLMDGLNPLQAILLANGQRIDPSWQIVGVEDFDTDGNVDILWQNPAGVVAVWRMSGVDLAGAEMISGAPFLGAAWRVAAVADFNGDAKADLLFRHVSGYLLLWLLDRTTFSKQLFLNEGNPVPMSWGLAGVSDFNNDQEPDILWQNTANLLAIWFMAGTEPISGSVLNHLSTVGSEWKIVGLGDFNRDNHTDFLWRNANGILAVWNMNATDVIGANLVNGGQAVPLDWRLASPR